MHCLSLLLDFDVARLVFLSKQPSQLQRLHLRRMLVPIERAYETHALAAELHVSAYLRTYETHALEETAGNLLLPRTLQFAPLLRMRRDLRHQLRLQARGVRLPLAQQP